MRCEVKRYNLAANDVEEADCTVVGKEPVSEYRVHIKIRGIGLVIKHYVRKVLRGSKFVRTI